MCICDLPDMYICPPVKNCYVTLLLPTPVGCVPQVTVSLLSLIRDTCNISVNSVLWCRVQPILRTSKTFEAIKTNNMSEQ